MSRLLLLCFLLMSISVRSQDLLRDYNLTPSSSLKVQGGKTIPSYKAAALKLLIAKSHETGIEFNEQDTVRMIAWTSGIDRRDMSGMLFSKRDTVAVINGQLYVSGHGKHAKIPLSGMREVALRYFAAGKLKELEAMDIKYKKNLIRLDGETTWLLTAIKKGDVFVFDDVGGMRL